MSDGERVRRVPLLTVDTEFLDAIPEAERNHAAGLVHVARVDRSAGTRWPNASELMQERDGVAAIVLDGLVAREVSLAGRVSVELYGPGDVLDGDDTSEQSTSWRVHDSTVLAVLDEPFVVASRRWPGLWQVLLRRSQTRAGRLTAHLAALQLSRVELRIVAVLWQLAERWGRVTGDGVVIPVPLTHHLLGQLVGARRPTVSLGLSNLAEQNLLHRRDDGGWLLAPESSRLLGGSSPADSSDDSSSLAAA